MLNACSSMLRIQELRAIRKTLHAKFDEMRKIEADIRELNGREEIARKDCSEIVTDANPIRSFLIHAPKSGQIALIVRVEKRAGYDAPFVHEETLEM